eukprot:1740694-Rhodomonas_salina.1
MQVRTGKEGRKQDSVNQKSPGKEGKEKEKKKQKKEKRKKEEEKVWTSRTAWPIFCSKFLRSCCVLKGRISMHGEIKCN